MHTAIAFGEDDFRLGAEQGLAVVNPVRLDGTYDERIGPYAGRWVKDADPDLVEDLRARGRLLRAERLLHAYPHCWRCGTPLLYYAKPSWYIRTSAMRDRLLAANETVDWYPPHIKHGRFGKWLENNVDWAISRERYWGTPLPIWRCENGHVEALGSLAEVSGRSGRELTDPHRPYVDEHTWPCADCGAEMRRVPEVIDVWFDSGSMPFAQRHAPFTGEERFRETFPADYICEAIDQTRGWFYSLIAISTLLFDRAPYRTVLCLGHIADSEGKKMSKSLGNIVVPWDVIHRHGADAFRWYFLTSKQPWDGYLFSTETVGESVRQFLLQLWNTYGFYVLYANANGVDAPGEPETELDRWAISRLHATIAVVRERMEDYDATRAGHAIAAFVDELSNWYVRRSRRRFWDGDPAAFGTLKTCLVEVSKLLAPFCPFVADAIYENLDGSEPSVHLCEFPEAGARDEALEGAMAVARETVRLGLAARGHGRLKVRQPLRAAVVVAAGEERAAIERMESIVLEELNVKALRFVSEADELGSYEVKPNYRALGPRFGKKMPQVAAAVEALDPSHVAVALRNGGHVGHQRRRPRPRAGRGRPHPRHAAARGLPARARGLTRRGAGARARRRAAPRGDRARGRARGAERAQGGRPAGRGPDRARSRRRRRAARGRTRARGLRRRRDARRAGGLRRAGRRDGGDRRAAAHRRRRAGLSGPARYRTSRATICSNTASARAWSSSSVSSWTGCGT